MNMLEKMRQQIEHADNLPTDSPANALAYQMASAYALASIAESLAVLANCVQLREGSKASFKIEDNR